MLLELLDKFLADLLVLSDVSAQDFGGVGLPNDTVLLQLPWHSNTVHAFKENAFLRRELNPFFCE